MLYTYTSRKLYFNYCLHTCTVMSHTCSEYFWQAHVTCSSVAGSSKAVLDVLVTCGSCPAIRTVAKEPSIQVLTHAEWKDTIIGPIIFMIIIIIGHCVQNTIHRITITCCLHGKWPCSHKEKSHTSHVQFGSCPQTSLGCRHIYSHRGTPIYVQYNKGNRL